MGADEGNVFFSPAGSVEFFSKYDTPVSERARLAAPLPRHTPSHSLLQAVHRGLGESAHGGSPLRHLVLQAIGGVVVVTNR